MEGFREEGQSEERRQQSSHHLNIETHARGTHLIVACKQVDWGRERERGKTNYIYNITMQAPDMSFT